MEAVSGRKEMYRRCVMCEAAGSVVKYRCPCCNKLTCSLKCVMLHKAKFSCSGTLDETKFVAIEEMDNITLLRDYRFLEETGRRLGDLSSAWLRDKNYGNAIRLRDKLKYRGVQLRLAPSIFEKRKQNKSFFNAKLNCVFWMIEVYFVNTDATAFISHVSERATLCAVLSKQMSQPRGNVFDANTLQTYAGHANAVDIFMATGASTLPSDRTKVLHSGMCEEISGCEKLCDLFRGKTIYEYPSFIVKLTDVDAVVQNTVDNILTNIVLRK